MTFLECIRAVSVSEYPEYFPELYGAMVSDGSIDHTALLEEGYIRAVDRKYQLFHRSLEAVLRSAEQIREDRALLRYTNLLIAAVLDRERFGKYSVPRIPPVTRGNGANDFLGMLAFLPAMDLTAKKMEAHGFDGAAICTSLREFEVCIDLHAANFGWAAMSQLYFGWLQRYIDVTIFPCGGFQFELTRLNQPVILLKRKGTGATAVLAADMRMHRDGMVLGSADFTDEDGAYLASFTETEAWFQGYPCGADGFCLGEKQRYDRAEWEIALRPGDPILSVHIPKGASLAGDAFEKARTGALELVRRHFPAFVPKAIGCFSWLLDPRIDKICGGAANIRNFQSSFQLFPILSEGEEIFRFVFTGPFRSYEELPEDSRLMRGLKKHYIGGKHIHAFGGVRLPDD